MKYCCTDFIFLFLPSNQFKAMLFIMTDCFMHLEPHHWPKLPKKDGAACCSWLCRPLAKT